MRTKNKRKLLAGVLSVAMVFTMLPLNVFADGIASQTGETAPITSLKVGDITLVDGGTVKDNNTDSVKYEPTTNTLTLTNATVNGEINAIAAENTVTPLNLVLEGTNIITGYSGTSANIRSPLNVSGTGTATFQQEFQCAGDCNITGVTLYVSNLSIYWANLTINDAKVTVRDLKNSVAGPLSVEKGDISATNSMLYVYGSQNGILTNTMNVSNSDVTAIGGMALSGYDTETSGPGEATCIDSKLTVNNSPKTSQMSETCLIIGKDGTVSNPKQTPTSFKWYKNNDYLKAIPESITKDTVLIPESGSKEASNMYYAIPYDQNDRPMPVSKYDNDGEKIYIKYSCDIVDTGCNKIEDTYYGWLGVPSTAEQGSNATISASYTYGGVEFNPKLTIGIGGEAASITLGTPIGLNNKIEKSIFYTGNQIPLTRTATVDEHPELNDKLVYTFLGRGGTTYEKSEAAPTEPGTYTLTVSIPENDLSLVGKVSLDFIIGEPWVEAASGNEKLRFVDVKQGIDYVSKKIKAGEKNATLTLLKDVDNIQLFDEHLNLNLGGRTLNTLMLVETTPVLSVTGDGTVNTLNAEKGTCTLSGGTYGMCNFSSNYVNVHIADGYGLKKIVGEYWNEAGWYTGVDDTLQDVTVKPAPYTIKTQTTEVDEQVYGQINGKLSVTIDRTAEYKDDTTYPAKYTWYQSNETTNGDEIITGATTNVLTLPSDLKAGTYDFRCIVDIDGYEKNIYINDVTIKPANGTITNKNYPTNHTYTAKEIVEPVAGNFTTNSGGTITFKWYRGNSTAETDLLSGRPITAGTYTLKASAASTDNYTAAETTETVHVSYLSTTAVATLADTNKGDNGWYKGKITVNSPAGYTISTQNSSSDGASWTTSLETQPNGTENFTYYLKNTNGLITDAKTLALKADTDVPTIGVISYSDHKSFLDWIFNNSKIDVTVPVSDEVSGSSHITYELVPEDGTTKETLKTADLVNGIATFAVDKTFKGTVNIIAYDKAGNGSATSVTKKMYIEDEAPTVIMTQDQDGKTPFTNSWYDTAKNIYVKASDVGSGISTITYTVDGGQVQQLYTSSSESTLVNEIVKSIPVTEGEHKYKIIVTDNALNSQTTELTVKQDTTAPTLSDIIAPAGDNLSDTTAKITFKSDDIGEFYYMVKAATDDAPNIEDVLNTKTKTTMKADGTNEINLTGLNRNTQYKVYVAAKDKAENKVTTLTALSFTTEKTSITDAVVKIEVPKNGFVYNGKAQNPTVVVTLGDKELASKDYEISYKNATTNDTTNTDAGTINVSISASADGDYEGQVSQTQNMSFEIALAAPTLAWQNETQTVTYTGSEAVITAPTVTGVAGDDSSKGTIKYAYKPADGVIKSLFTGYTDGLPVNSGKYLIKAHIEANGNYEAADSTQTLELTINKSTPTVTIKDDYSGKTYDGTAVANPTSDQITITGANYDGVIFKYSKNNDMSSPLAGAPTDAGTYYVQASVVATNNTNGATSSAKSFAITKAAAPTPKSGQLKVTNNLAKVYEFDLKTLLTQGKNFGTTTYTVKTGAGTSYYGEVNESNIKSGKLNLSVKSVESDTESEVGTITVTVTSQNYENMDATITVKSTNKTVPTVTISGSYDYTYGQKLSDKKLTGTAKDGTTAIEGTFAWTAPETVPTAGTTLADWKFTPSDSEKYAEVTGTQTITVAKVTPTGAPTYTEITTSGKTLADTNFMLGTITLPGTIKWDLETTTEVKQGIEYSWTFTPTDTINYTELTGKITLWKNSNGGGIYFPPTDTKPEEKPEEKPDKTPEQIEAEQIAKITSGIKNTSITSVKAISFKGKIKLTWNKSKGYKVDGYVVYRTTGNNSYKKMISKKGNYYVNSKALKKGTTYKYKIVGFRKVGGKTVYTKAKIIQVKAR